MSEYSRNEIAVGIFVIFGIAAVGYLSASIGGVEFFPGPKTRVTAKFASIGDLKEGASVRVAGVQVGEVERIELNDTFDAVVSLALNAESKMPVDTIASIRTSGLLGESFVLLRPGGADENLQTGDRVQQTEPAVDLIDLFVKYALDSSDDEGKSGDTENDDDFDEEDDIPDP